MTKPEDLIKCYMCHKNLLQEKVIDGKVVKMFHPERTQTEFYLNNGSRMPVSLCLTCKNMELNNPIVHNRIMKNVIDGWQIEQDILLERGEIKKEHSDKIMEHHRKLSILFKSEGLNDYQIRSRV